MSYVSYNSKKIIPAPFVQIKPDWIRSADGSRIGRTLIITLTGSLIVGRGGLWSGSGYPADDYSLSRLEDLLAKQQALRDLFATDYAWFEIKPDPEATSQATKWIVKVVNMEFPTSQLVQHSQYVITLEAQLGDTTDDYDMISDYDETWELSYQEDPEDTYVLTHNITCSSKEQYVVATTSVTEGWKKAQAYATNQLGGSGVDNTIVQQDPGFNLSSSFIAYNHVIDSTIDEYSGIYTIRETWKMSSTVTHKTKTINVDRQRDVPVDEPDIIVSISGSVVGFKTVDGGGYTTAKNEFTLNVAPDLYSDANSLVTDDTLRTNPKSRSVVYDEIHRRVDYTYVYDNGADEASNDKTVTISESEEICGKITAVVSGSIRGVKTLTQSAYTNALSVWNAFKSTIESEATTVYTEYGGTDTLQGPSHISVSYNEYNGQIGYSYTYNDWPVPYMAEETITTRENIAERADIQVYNGTVKGFCNDGTANTKYDNAVTGYNVVKPTTPENYIKISSSESRNIRMGTINYSFEFKEDKACVSGAISDSIVITDEQEADVFAVVPILGGPPVLQDKGGSTALMKSIQIEVHIPPPDGCILGGSPNVESIVDSAEPSADIVLVSKNSNVWNPRTGRYSRTKSWVYGNCD